MVIVSPKVRPPRLYMGWVSSLSGTCRRWSPKMLPVAAGRVKVLEGVAAEQGLKMPRRSE